jgi:putative hemolysin
MIPRSQVVALDGRQTLREVLPLVRRRPHSIYPVYDGEIDQPLGMVRILQLTAPEALDRPLRELVHPAAIFPETVKGLRLLGDLSRAEIPAALVVDEFGSLAGFVTIEDLMEVAIGELEGEHEVVRSRVLTEGDGAWRIDGACTIEEFERRFGPLIPEGEYETVAGFFLDRLGEIPEVGTEIELVGLRLEVIQRSERRIVWVRAERVEAALAPE